MSHILQCPNLSSTPREGRTGYPWVLPFNLWEFFTPFPQKSRAEGRRRLVVSPSPAPWLLSQPVTERWGGGEMTECPLVPQPVLPLPCPQHLHCSIPSALGLALGFPLIFKQGFPEFYLRAEIFLKPSSLLFKSLFLDSWVTLLRRTRGEPGVWKRQEGLRCWLVSYLTFKRGCGALNTQQRQTSQHFHQNQIPYNCDREENVPLLAPDRHVTSSPSQYTPGLWSVLISLQSENKSISHSVMSYSLWPHGL